MSGHRVHRLTASITAVAVAAAVVAVSGTAAAEEPRRIGIVVSTTVNVTEAEADAIASELGAALSSALPVDIIAGGETRRRLPPDGLPDECIARAECRTDLGDRLDASELLLIVVVKIGERVQIDATWANVASGKAISRAAVVVEAGADRAKVFADAAPTLLPHIKRAEPNDRRPDIIVVPGATTPGDGRHMTTGSWIAVGVSGAALIGGTVFALSARNKFNALDGDGCRDMRCPQSEVDSMERRALAADVLYGVSIAAGVTALVMYLRSDAGDEEPPAEPAVTVGAGPGSVGFAIRGRF